MRSSPSRPRAKQRRRGAADEDGVVVAGLQAAEDVVAEAGGAHGCRQRGHPHAPDRGGPQARQDHRQGERQLDHAKALPRRHADTLRGFAHGRVDPRESGDRVAKDRKQAVEHEAQESRQEPDARTDPALDRSGTITARSARAGTVWITPARPRTRPSRRGARLTRISDRHGHRRTRQQMRPA